MFLTTRPGIATLIAVLLIPSPASPIPTAHGAPLVSLHPSIAFVGGTDAERDTVMVAAGRFISEGLPLPDLEIRFHDDSANCNGHRGLFHHNDGAPVIDLCFRGEFLALHELGHAWEHFNLDDQARAGFQELAGAPTWNSSEIAHRDRAIEIAANVMGHGLSSEPLAARQDRSREFALYEALTGSPTPRVAIEESPESQAEQLELAAAYAGWSRSAGDEQAG